jgi:imidazolonepropionase-like amidohydrolase
MTSQRAANWTTGQLARTRLRIWASVMSWLFSMLLASGLHAADLLIENVSVVSPELVSAVSNRYVLVRDGRIITVSARPIAAAKDAQRVNGKGKFLTPGIMDAHVHVTSTSGIPFPTDDPALLKLREQFLKQQPRSYLYFGVTQVLDPSNEPTSIATFEAQPLRPDLFRCGAAPALDGYPTVFLDKPFRYQAMPDWIYEPANAKEHPLPPGADAATHTPDVIVERIAKSGARCVKLFVEDGFGAATDWPILTPDTMKKTIAAAHQRGLLVMAHANALGMQRIAVDAGVDVLAHGVWNWDEVSDTQGVPKPIAAHLASIKAKEIGYQPTLRVIYGLADLYRADTLRDPMYRAVVPPEVLAWYGTEPGQWYKRLLRGEYGGATDEKMMSIHIRTGAAGMRAMKYLNVNLGYPLLLGSDTPSSPTFGQQPGYDTYREMRLMAQGGIALSEILKAATINNARQFGIDKDYGTIAPGKIANLLLLNANPLTSVSAWSQIHRIVLHGQVLERESLRAK